MNKTTLNKAQAARLVGIADDIAERAEVVMGLLDELQQTLSTEQRQAKGEDVHQALLFLYGAIRQFGDGLGYQLEASHRLIRDLIYCGQRLVEEANGEMSGVTWEQFKDRVQRVRELS